MAQVRAGSQAGREDLGWERGGARGEHGPLAVLHVQDVPRPLLAALAVMLALAVAACVALWRVAGTEVTYARADGGTSAEAGASDAASDRAEGTAASTHAETSVEQEPAQALVVDVGGAVASPGVYELAEGARVKDAVTKAGGLAKDADTSTVNLAQRVADGQKVVIPRVGEATPAQGVQGVEAMTDAGTQGGLVNINTADVAELDTLPGVGESTARAIVEDRERNGAFAAPEDLMRVSGIGEKKFARLESLICV